MAFDMSSDAIDRLILVIKDAALPAFVSNRTARRIATAITHRSDAYKVCSQMAEAEIHVPHLKDAVIRAMEGID